MSRKPQSTASKKHLTSGLLKYSAAATTALALGHGVDASIISVDVSGWGEVNLSGANDFGVFAFDLDGDATDDFNVNGSRSFFSTIYTTTTGSGSNYTFSSRYSRGAFAIYGAGTNQVATADRWVADLGSNDGVQEAIGSGGQNFATIFSTWTGVVGRANAGIAPDTNNSLTGMVGLAFSKGGNTHYGWLEILTSRDSAGRPETLRVLSAAYESQPGVDIQAGAVPEPETVGLGLGLLALGAAGVRSMRQRRESSAD